MLKRLLRFLFRTGGALAMALLLLQVAIASEQKFYGDPVRIVSGNLVSGITTTAGKLVLSDGSSNTLTVTVQAMSADRTIALPDEAPIAGWLVSTDASGNWSYLDPGTLGGTSATEVILEVWNNTGSLIPVYKAVYINGFDGGSGLPTIALARADSAATANVIGCVWNNGGSGIADGASGFVTVHGMQSGMDSSPFSVGDELYLSATTAGNLTATAPEDPDQRRRVATVSKDSPSGQWEVNLYEDKSSWVFDPGDGTIIPNVAERGVKITSDGSAGSNTEALRVESSGGTTGLLVTTSGGVAGSFLGDDAPYVVSAVNSATTGAAMGLTSATNSSDNAAYGIQTDQLEVTTYSDLDEVSAPATPGSGKGRVYMGTDGRLRVIDDAGTSYDLTAWLKSGTNISPTTADDDLLLHDSSTIQFGNGNPGTADTEISRIAASVAGMAAGDAFRVSGYMESADNAGVTNPASGFTRWYSGPGGEPHSVDDLGLDRALSGLIYTAQAASSAISNTTTETSFTIGTFTFPADSLTDGMVIRGRCYMRAATTATPNLTLRLKLDTITLATVVFSSLNLIAATDGYIEYELTIITVGASGTAWGSMSSSFNRGLPQVGGSGTAAVGSVDTTNTCVVEVTAQWSAASASNTITMYPPTTIDVSH